MKTRRFIMVVDANRADAKLINAITRHLKSRFKYWHWFNHTWLLVPKTTYKPDPGLTEIISDLEAAVPLVKKCPYLIVRVDSDSRSAGGRLSEEKYKWIPAHWANKANAAGGASPDAPTAPSDVAEDPESG